MYGRPDVAAGRHRLVTKARQDPAHFCRDFSASYLYAHTGHPAGKRDSENAAFLRRGPVCLESAPRRRNGAYLGDGCAILALSERDLGLLLKRLMSFYLHPTAVSSPRHAAQAWDAQSASEPHRAPPPPADPCGLASNKKSLPPQPSRPLRAALTDTPRNVFWQT